MVEWVQKYFFPVLLMGPLIGLLTGCTGLPRGVVPVTDFELDRYLGQWYEIARLDHSFERGLHRVTAHYSLREDGGVTVFSSRFRSMGSVK